MLIGTNAFLTIFYIFSGSTLNVSFYFNVKLVEYSVLIAMSLSPVEFFRTFKRLKIVHYHNYFPLHSLLATTVAYCFSI